MSMEIRTRSVVDTLRKQSKAEAIEADHARGQITTIGRWLRENASTLTRDKLRQASEDLATAIERLAGYEDRAHDYAALADAAAAELGMVEASSAAASPIEAAARKAVATGHDRAHLLGKPVTVHLSNGTHHRGELTRDDNEAVVLDSPLGPIVLASEGVASIEPYEAKDPSATVIDTDGGE